MDDHCSYCGKPPSDEAALLRCTRCRQAQYHDVTCQKRDYRKHKDVCRQINAEYLEGMEVIDSAGEDLGLVAVAARDFKPGDVVLSERTTLAFDKNRGYAALWEAFRILSAKHQKEILDMYHPEKSATKGRGEIFREWKMYTAQLPSSETTFQGNRSIGIDLVSIVNNNAYSLSNTYNGDQGYRFNAEPVGLFTLGSKLEHSCVPNVATRISPLGLLEINARTSIQKGDRLSSCYIGNHFIDKARQDRRDILVEDKAFFCKCARCREIDESIPLKCRACSDGVICLTDEQDQWKCVVCEWTGSQSSFDLQDQFAQQTEAMKKLEELDSQIRYMSNPREALEKLLSIPREGIHPLHLFHLQFWNVLYTATSKVVGQRLKNGASWQHPEVFRFTDLLAYSLLMKLLWMEQHVSIIYGRLGMKEAVQSPMSCMGESIELPVKKEKLRSLLDQATSGSHYKDLPSVSYLIQSITDAGLELMKTGGDELTVQLFSTYMDILGSPVLKESGFYEKARVLVESGGQENHFIRKRK